MTTKLLIRSALGTLGILVGGALIARQRIPVRDAANETDISLVSIFDGTTLRPQSSRFTGGSIYSVFGGTRLDLRRAGLEGRRGHLEVTTVYGGTEITVPDTWRVSVEGPTIAAGRDISVTDPATLDADAPQLSITARTIFGGLKVAARPILRSAEMPA